MRKPPAKLHKVVLVLAACATLLASLSLPLRAQAQTAVTLSRFTATGRSDNILIEWETATEFNNAGFFVWASDSENGTYDPISDFIEAQGDGVTGAMYEYVDNFVDPEIPRYYKLEAIELNQNSEFFGPVAATANSGSSTSTPTPTRTQALVTSATATQVLTGQEASRTPTATRPGTNPTNTQSVAAGQPTATQGNESAYPGQSANPTVAGGIGSAYPENSNPTAIPAYPDQDTTSVVATPASGQAGSTVVTPPQGSPNPNQTGTVTPSAQVVALAQGDGGIKLPPFTALFVILVIWAMLAGWFYISVRRLE